MVLDGVDELDEVSSALGHLSWLPMRSSGVRVVVSSGDASLPTLARLSARRPFVLRLQPLSVSDQRAIIAKYFLRYGKQVDERTMELLIGGQLGRSGEWLGLALEELRIHGSFRSLFLHFFCT